jgi:hypothetical protein
LKDFTPAGTESTMTLREFCLRDFSGEVCFNLPKKAMIYNKSIDEAGKITYEKPHPSTMPVTISKKLNQ